MSKGKKTLFDYILLKFIDHLTLFSYLFGVGLLSYICDKPQLYVEHMFAHQRDHLPHRQF